MQFRLKTSKKTETIFNTIYQKEYLQPFALAKISIAMALKSGYKFSEERKLMDSTGLELNRQTITSDNDSLFKALVELNEGNYILDEEYFPDYVKGYIDYGALLLEQEFRYGRDFYKHILNLEEGI